MVTKRSIITGLVGLNLSLLAAMILGNYSPPAAKAQAVGASANFVAVTCQADVNYDVLYVLELGRRTLHCFAPNRDQSGKVDFAGSRDLSDDFTR